MGQRHKLYGQLEVEGQMDVGGTMNVGGEMDVSGAMNVGGSLVVTDDTSNVTLQGNTFNGADQLVQLDASAKLPALDGSNLTNLPTPPSTGGNLYLFYNY